MRLISLLLACATPALALSADSVSISVDASKDLGEISPLVYGINGNDHASRPYIPFSRQGGNRMTAYNWENNASNAGNDWHHQNDAFLGGGDKPGEVTRSYLQGALADGHTAIITIPMAGYVAADKKADGDVNQTPDFLNKRFVKSYPKKNGKFAYPPDLNDGAVYQDEFVWWINQQFPGAMGRIFYDLDNEPDLWDGTHARLRTQKLTYSEIVQRTVELASAIKDVVPNAVIFGFVSYGYAGYINLQGAKDANDRDFIDFFLQQMQAAQKQSGKRLVDVLDLHWYPEARGGGARITERGNAETVKARVQAPRSLWDPTYTEDSWISRDVIHGPVHLLPRIWAKIDKFYPGTKLAFTEYDYGGGGDISGAVAEADVLGIFGEQKVFAAALWGGGPFIYAGFDAYVNYDGKGGHYGDVALSAMSSNVADVAVHASRYTKDPSKLALVLINRSQQARTCGLDVKGFAWTKATVHRIEGNTPKVKAAGEVKSTEGLTLPAMSVTTLVLEK